MKFKIRSLPILCEPAAQNTGKIRISATACFRPCDDLLDLQRTFIEELLHQGVVALGHHFDEGFVGFLCGIRQIGGNVAFFTFAVAVRCIGVSLHANEVDDAFEVAFGPDGKLDGNGGAAEILVDAREGALEVGAFAVELIDHDGAGKLEIVGKAPDLLGLHFHAGHAIHHHQGGIGRYQGGAGVIDKDVVAGGIEDVDLGFFPFSHGDGRGNGDFAGDFLFVKIGYGIAFIDAEEAVGGSGGEEQSGGESGLPGIAVAHHPDVPNVFAFVYFHGLCSRIKTE